MNADTLENELFAHRPFLLRLAAGLVGPDDAEDLVQDVWTRALVAERPTPASARAWLARVARNLATSGFRSRSRRERREREHTPEEGGSGGMEETAERFELVQRIGAAVQTLAEPYKSVVLLRYFEGLEHAAIAEKLGVPLATVRTRQQRALALLREKLDREFGGREAWSVALGAWLSRALPTAATTPLAVKTWL
ncbi:MAG: RNA polymerase sigma factor, partial [Planctomycetota bacterium]